MSEQQANDTPEAQQAGEPVTPALLKVGGAGPETEQGAQDAGERAAPRRGHGMSGRIALAIAIAVAAFTGWQWLDSRNRLTAVQEGVAQRLSSFEASVAEARAIAERTQEVARETAVTTGVLDNKLTEFQNHQVALEALYQELARGRDEWTLAEIEQILMIANQQLQLAGDVKAALVAMQTADNRLQRVDKPQLIPLRKAIARDMERLKATPYVDTAGLALRLDALVAAVDTLPLAVENRPPPPSRGTSVEGNADLPAWKRLGLEIWSELKGLVRIHQAGKPEAPLLAPDQIFFLRENLRLRLLSGRIALLQRDQVSYVQDLSAARDWVERYFDGEDQRTTHMLDEIRQMLESKVDIHVPDVSGSLDAVRNYKLVEGGSR